MLELKHRKLSLALALAYCVLWNTLRLKRDMPMMHRKHENVRIRNRMLDMCILGPSVKWSKSTELNRILRLRCVIATKTHCKSFGVYFDLVRVSPAHTI